MKVCPIVSLGMHLQGHPSMHLTLYVVPTICEPLVRQPVAACIDQHHHLLGLELADFTTSESSLPVDVLIRSNYYWELVTGVFAEEQTGLPRCTPNWVGCCLAHCPTEILPNVP